MTACEWLALGLYCMLTVPSSEGHNVTSDTPVSATISQAQVSNAVLDAAKRRERKRQEAEAAEEELEGWA